MTISLRGAVRALAIALFLLLMGAAPASALGLGILNHLSVSGGVGTSGITVEAATTFTTFVQLRAGVSIMPDIKFHADADYAYAGPDGARSDGRVRLRGALGRVQGQVIANVYPVPVLPLFVAVGGYFGGTDLVKITGRAPELAAGGAGAVIGDWEIPADRDGNISGSLRVKKFRPYLGVGWGRAVPGGLLGFTTELGLQFEGKPEVRSDHDRVEAVAAGDNNTFNKVRKALAVYPTLTFRLAFKAF